MTFNSTERQRVSDLHAVGSNRHWAVVSAGCQSFHQTLRNGEHMLKKHTEPSGTGLKPPAVETGLSGW